MNGMNEMNEMNNNIIIFNYKIILFYLTIK
jgi:hypothetical protein